MQLLGNQLIDLSNPDIIKLDIDSTSKGNQVKHYDTKKHLYIKEQFEYQGKLWKDSYVEHLAWRLSTMTDTLGVEIVKQDVVTLSNGRLACVSKDFCYDTDYEWLSMYRLLNGMVIPIGQSYKVFRKLTSTINKRYNVDITDYLIVMIVLDYLVGNEDRHYNNFGILRGKGDFKIAPLFDFGLGLFEHDNRYENASLEDAISVMDGKPFSRDLYQPINMLINSGYKEKVQRILSGIRVPHKDIFPNTLGYSYFCNSLSRMEDAIK